MRYRFTLNGVSGLICHNGAAGLDKRSPVSLEIASIAAKKGGNRTETDDLRLRTLECQRSLYLDSEGRPTFPEAAIRRMIENAARKQKQGPLVREGLLVESVEFSYDEKRYGTDVEDVGENTAFVVPVVVQRQRIERTRAKFDPPWSMTVTVDTDDELVDAQKLAAWLEVGGRRIGLGDWRPERSGSYGRFTVSNVKEVKDE